MDEQELREMIRASIARHSGTGLQSPVVSGVNSPVVSGFNSPVVSGFSRTEEVRLKADTTFGVSPAFARLPLLRSGDEDGACVIEPTVRCNHCGYCLSYGH
jgi:hypothetical protein